MNMNKDKVVRDFVCRPSVVAVVGASPSPGRAVSGVMAYLADSGFRLFPVNPAYAGEKILGMECVGRLLDLPREVDVVALFIAAKNQAAVLRELREMPYRPVVWMQPGAENPEAQEDLESEGFSVVSGECLMMKHRTDCAARD
jgi:predicted CoA-binding protein